MMLMNAEISIKEPNYSSHETIKDISFWIFIVVLCWSTQKLLKLNVPELVAYSGLF